MRVFTDNKSKITWHDMAKLVALAVLFYAFIWELAAAIGRQAGIW